MSRAAQLGMFGAEPSGREIHTVAAHPRVLADGSEVFVAEHLRWSRGRRSRRAPEGPRPVAPVRVEPDDAASQLGLFDDGRRVS